jgi:choline-glycine betaine transporter
MVLVAIFFVSGADAASMVMGTLSERGSIHPSRGVVVFWGVVMGAIAAVMLLVGGDDALTGIQNLTIIMAVPFGLVMILLCIALTRDLRHDPLIRRDDRSQQAVEQAVDYGVETYGDQFFINVKPTPPLAPPRIQVDGDGHRDGHVLIHEDRSIEAEPALDASADMKKVTHRR